MARAKMTPSAATSPKTSADSPRSRCLLPQCDPQSIAALGQALGIGVPAAAVLCHRGLADAVAAKRFLAPSLADLHDPLLMLDMAPAVERLLAAIRASEKILLYGDYDVDGTTSVVILSKIIELAGGVSSWHVPHRLKDGYGMRPEVVEQAAAEGVKLIVSVDTGIRAGEVVRRAAELGIDVIVTDHHLPDTELPPALAVLNPNRPDCPYPEKNLCGAGVAFKLMQALLSRLEWPEPKQRRVEESFLKMAAIATIADVVPLRDENRIIVKHGLDGLNSVRNPGLRALLDVAGFTGGLVPDARQVAFQIAPRINAAGRMDTAAAVIEMFLTGDAERARELAKHLHDQNSDRQQVEADIRELCEALPVDEAAAAFVYYSEEWHRGVLGIVASRLVERLHRPVFVLGRNEEDGQAQGSGRSIPAFHLLEALESMPELFVKFGGHAHAAGVTLKPANIEEFRRRLNEFAASRLTPEDFLRRIEIDAVIQLRDLNEETTEELFRLAPFGHGNPAPMLAALAVEVAHVAPLKDKHLRVTVRQNGRALTLKAWNFAERAAELAVGRQVDVAFQVEPDAYSAARGYPPWCAVLKDVR
ncbi:MAG TPA: single-stranded-DNA-specific exonuclease RecJ [Candidatus Limnocylindrales bacterium]|nr:single-stranded-DNA-specific exonuclease RecJ [Candidatus Limnocylindrales bacterium]